MQSSLHLLWFTVKPLLKVVLTAGAGYIFARYQVVTPMVVQGMSKIILYLFLPSLLFAKTAAGFDVADAGLIAIVAAVSVTYLMVGLGLGLIFRSIVKVPKGLRGVILFACTFPNWGDIPLSVVLSVAGSPPFTTNDDTRGVAYVSVFVAVATVAMYSCGGYKLIEVDSTETEEIECKTMGLEAIESMSCRCAGDDRCNGKHAMEESAAIVVSPNPFAGSAGASTGDASVSIASLSSSTLTSQSSLPKTATQIPPSTCTSPPSQFSRVYLNPLFRLLKPLLYPPSLATFLGLLVGFVPPLKVLFVGTPPGLGTEPNEGPTLGFMWEAAGFIGGASVPCSLLLLGASTFTNSRLTPPYLSSRYLPPLLCLTLLVIRPLILIPVLTFVLFPHLSLSQKMLRFVLVLQACTPTGTSVVYLTRGRQRTEVARWVAWQAVVGIATVGAMVAFCVGGLT